MLVIRPRCAILELLDQESRHNNVRKDWEVSQNGSSPPVSPVVRRCIENLESPNPRQRSQAAGELGEHHAVEAVPALIRVLNTDINTYVRTAAAEALGHIGDSQATFPLVDAMRDSSSFVRRAAAIALGQLEAKEAQVALIHALDDPNLYVRRAAINAIGKLGIHDLGKVLLSRLDTGDPRMRRTIITALRRLKTNDAIPTMVEMLEGYMNEPGPRDLPVVKTLVIALGDLHAKEAVPVLIAAVRGYVGARSLAAAALGQIGDVQACPVLVEALADPSASLRLAALRSLGRLACPGTASIIREFLTSGDPRLRRVAAITLGHLHNRDSIPKLIEIAREDPSPLVRPVAVEALGLIGDPRVLEHLVPLAKDTNAYVRAALSQALCLLDDGSPAVEQALKKLLGDEVHHVASAAQQAKEMQRERPHEEINTVCEPDKKGSWLRRLLHLGR